MSNASDNNYKDMSLEEGETPWIRVCLHNTWSQSKMDTLYNLALDGYLLDKYQLCSHEISDLPVALQRDIWQRWAEKIYRGWKRSLKMNICCTNIKTFTDDLIDDDEPPPKKRKLSDGGESSGNSQ